MFSRWAAALIALSLPLSACVLVDLSRNLEVLQQRAFISGVIEDGGRSKGDPLVVLLIDHGDNVPKVQSYQVLAQPGRFEFEAPPGRYALAAYEERSQDLAYAPGERAGHYRQGKAFEVRPRERLGSIVIRIDTPDSEAFAYLADLTKHGRFSTVLDDAWMQLGKVVSLDDPRFSDELGAMGMWRPVEFMAQRNADIYFLEEYDPKRTPVMFVHGYSATPRKFRTLAAGLDHTRFQPWFVYYASALPVASSAGFLSQWLDDLRVRFRVRELHVVAHSMGGMVALSALQQQDPQVEWPSAVRTFVSISTPWAGHEAIELAVNNSPVVMPAWVDLQTGSPFLQNLFLKPQPVGLDFHLIFSIKKGNSILLAENNDGTVTLASQLRMEAQEEAETVFGFNEGHNSIVESQAVVERLNGLLGK